MRGLNRFFARIEIKPSFIYIFTSRWRFGCATASHCILYIRNDICKNGVFSACLLKETTIVQSGLPRCETVLHFVVSYKTCIFWKETHSSWLQTTLPFCFFSAFFSDCKCHCCQCLGTGGSLTRTAAAFSLSCCHLPTKKKKDMNRNCRKKPTLLCPDCALVSIFAICVWQPVREPYIFFTNITHAHEHLNDSRTSSLNVMPSR